MKVTDLKIKNLVEYKTEIFTITEIFQNGNDYFVKIENESHAISVPAEKISPIQITEDWLEKFGFLKTYASDQQIIRYERPESFIKYDIDLNSKKIFEGLKIYGNTIKCKYIHEFQNIFSCLFGKETTVFLKSSFHKAAI